MSATSALLFLAASASFPLEWNPTYDTAVPYEVELNPAKLGIAADGAFTVSADGRALPTEVLEGRFPGCVRLRFRVPEGTKELSASGNPATPQPRNSATPQPRNLFAGAVEKGGVARWKGSNGLKIVFDEELGITARAEKAGDAELVCEAEVPPECAGKPAFLELDVMNIAKMTSGNPVVIDQLDAAGKVLSEALTDPRWITHMRPVRKLAKLREPGRFHPLAKKLRIRFTMRQLRVAAGEYGLPVKNAADTYPALAISRLVVRDAAELPFPGYRDDFFAAGVSGRTGDTALVLGGDRAFWYDTHSHAVWAQAKRVGALEECFYPDREGTVEAWLKPSWQQENRIFNVFIASHRYNSNEARRIKPKGEAMSLKYRPSDRLLMFSIKGWDDREYRKQLPVEFPSGEWTHVAVQWYEAGKAEVFLNGRPVIELPLENFQPWDLSKYEDVPVTARIPLEFYVGANYPLGRTSDGFPSPSPFYPGAIDDLRVSSVIRYRGAFTPAKDFAVDADTRAFFGFDRSFDGTSGGGAKFISGTILAKEGRVAREVRVNGEGRTVTYWPKEIEAANNPTKVLSNLNYPVLPTADDFRTARKSVTKTCRMKAGESVKFECPEGTVCEFLEIANRGKAPLVYPVVINRGEFDPRSFGDLADSLMNGYGDISDREKANRVFQFALGASDYHMMHTVCFPPDSDAAEMVVYKALMMLNGYCGFECGPLNNMTANFLSCVARCPASGLAGYGHEFEQVHFDGKNHTYDLSAQKFFPAMDNESSSCLSESEVEPGLHNRIGAHSGSFIRSTARGYFANNPSYQTKVAMILNPGERFRMYRANDGHQNDLHIHRFGVGEKQSDSSYREDYAPATHAKLATTNTFLCRMDRWFPHVLNGFVTFDGAPAKDNPAFGDFAPDSFTYRVKSCYPIVHGEYAATLKDGKPAALELSTDGGRTYRPFGGPLDYEVRARVAYFVRVKAPVASVRRFRASTEVIANPRVFPGKVRAGANDMLFKAVPPALAGLAGSETDAGAAEVTFGWSVPAKKLEIVGTVHTGFIPGFEKRVTFVDPAAKFVELGLVGASAKVAVECTKGVSAAVSDGRLRIAAAKDAADPSIACVTVKDGGAVERVYAIVSSRIRFIPLAGAELLGGAKRVEASAAQIQASAWLEKKGDGVKFGFPAVAKGDYTFFFVDRFPSDQASPNDLNRQYFDFTWKGLSKNRRISSGGGTNHGCNFYKARYGSLEGRSVFKWDYVLDEFQYRPYFPRYEPKVLGLGEGVDAIEVKLNADNPKGAELVCAALVPEIDRAFYCEMTKLLCGMNCDPAAIRE